MFTKNANGSLGGSSGETKCSSSYTLRLEQEKNMGYNLHPNLCRIVHSKHNDSLGRGSGEARFRSVPI